uniref:PE423R n=1 Tax=African swine fever virus TaxID=10497 RepID=A0A6G7KTY1_ASF
MQLQNLWTNSPSILKKSYKRLCNCVLLYIYNTMYFYHKCHRCYKKPLSKFQSYLSIYSITYTTLQKFVCSSCMLPQLLLLQKYENKYNTECASAIQPTSTPWRTSSFKNSTCLCIFQKILRPSILLRVYTKGNPSYISKLPLYFILPVPERQAQQNSIQKCYTPMVRRRKLFIILQKPEIRRWTWRRATAWPSSNEQPDTTFPLCTRYKPWGYPLGQPTRTPTQRICRTKRCYIYRSRRRQKASPTILYPYCSYKKYVRLQDYIQTFCKRLLLLFPPLCKKIQWPPSWRPGWMSCSLPISGKHFLLQTFYAKTCYRGPKSGCLHILFSLLFYISPVSYKITTIFYDSRTLGPSMSRTILPTSFYCSLFFQGRPVPGFREPWRRRMWKRILRHFYKVFSPLRHKIPLFWLPPSYLLYSCT